MHFDIEVSGRVQHVGFRFFALARARELGVTGYVRNLPDGTLHVIAEGEMTDLETLADLLREGPSRARVTGVTISKAPFSGSYHRFEIKY